MSISSINSTVFPALSDQAGSRQEATPQSLAQKNPLPADAGVANKAVNALSAVNLLSDTMAIHLPSQLNNIAQQQGLYEYAEARDFSVELTTKEGDKVRIHATSGVGVSVTAGRDKNGVSGSGSQSSSNQFELSVDGNLNDN